MGGTKIFVVQLRQVIKILIITIVAFILIGMLVYIFFPKNSTTEDIEGNTVDSTVDMSEAMYYPGTYYSEIILHNDPVTVGVTVTEDEIVSIDMEEMNETQQAFYPLFEPSMEDLSSEILETQTLNVSIDTSSAQTEEILMHAIVSSLNQAEEKAAAFNSDID